MVHVHVNQLHAINSRDEASSNPEDREIRGLSLFRTTGRPLSVRNLTQGISGGDSFFARNPSMPVTRELFKREILRQFGAANRRAFWHVDSKSVTWRNAGTASHSEMPLERGQ
jgi:hypothetical protein